jgi:hypothetical protein
LQETAVDFITTVSSWIEAGTKRRKIDRLNLARELRNLCSELGEYNIVYRCAISKDQHPIHRKPTLFTFIGPRNWQLMSLTFSAFQIDFNFSPIGEDLRGLLAKDDTVDFAV